jgi:hypothetical protein
VSGRNPRYEAADAARLKDDPALTAILGHLEADATMVAISDFDPATRDRGRYLSLAIRALRQEIQDRIDTVLLIEANRQRERASET